MGVELSEDSMRQVNQCNQRLISERNLRFNLESVKVPESSHDNVKEMTELIESANKNSVEEMYLKQAGKFQQQMTDNIEAREIL